MQQNVHATGDRSPTIPAPPVHTSPEVAAYLAAQERVRLALLEQARCIAALKAFDSRHPAVML